MYEDVPIANMPNKVRVIEYQNENVIPIQSDFSEKFNNPRIQVFGGFFLPFSRRTKT